MITAENITPRKYNVKGTVTTVFYGKVNTKLIGINNVLRGNLALARQKKQRKIITDQNITRQRRESALETQPNVEKKRNVTEKIPKAGGLNILGWFRNFIGKIVLGVLAVQLVGQTPLLKNILTGALKVADFLSSAGVFLVDAFSTFINFGYNAYDSTRGFLKNIGGDSVINLFDGFMDKLSVLVDVLLVASLLKGTGSFDPLMRRGRQPKPQRTPNLLEQLFGGKKKSKSRAPGGSGLGRIIGTFGPGVKSKPGEKEARIAIDRRARALAKERRKEESRKRKERATRRSKGLREPIETREKRFGGRKARFAQRKKFAVSQISARSDTLRLTQLAVGDFDANKPEIEKVFSKSDIEKLKRFDQNLYQAQLRGDALDIETQTRVRNDFYNRMLKKAGGRRRKIIRKKLIQAELLRRKGQSAPKSKTVVEMTAPRPSVSEVLRGRKGKDRQFFKKLERDPKMRRLAVADFESQQADEALRRLMGQRRPDDFDPGMSDLARAMDSSGRARVRGRGAQRAPKRFLIRTFGKQGTRILRSVPLIGGILDFGLNLAFGEPIGRAAGKAVFAGIGGFIGGAIGKALGLLTGPFAVVVSPLLAGLFGLGGGALGDWIGGLVYDAVTRGMDLPAFLTQNPLTGFFEKATEKVSSFINNLVEGATEFFGLGGPSTADQIGAIIGGYEDEKGKAPPPTSRPGSKGIPLPPREPAIPPRKSPMGGKVNFGSLLDLVTSGEGGLNSVNRGNAGDTPGGAKSILGKNLTDMTLDEVFAAQNAERVFAVGKYQIIPKTMKGFRDYLIAQGIDTSRRKFDASLQNMFGPYSINQKRAKVGRFLRGDTSVSLDTAQLELAAEYASIGVPYDMKKGSYNGKYPLRDIKKGESLYSGTGSNYAPAAHTDSIRSMLQKLREKASYEDQSSSNIIINSDQIASNNQPQVNTDSPNINISVASGGGDPFDGLYVM